MNKLLDQNTNDDVVSAIDSLGFGIAIWSSENSLVKCNLEFSRHFDIDDPDSLAGLSVKQLVEKIAQASRLILPENRREWRCQEEQAILSNKLSQYRFVDGTICEVKRWPTKNDGKVHCLQDITQSVRNKRTLEKERDKSTEAERTKSRFLRAANHDLRQPLASLKIMIYNCLETKDTQERDQLLHNMDISVSIMEDLLGALLNIGQLDAGRIEPKISTFQISTILDRMRLQFEHQAQEKGLTFRVMPSKHAVVSDRALLERIVSNFVANAIKYTETGGVLLGCRKRGDRLYLEVWDTGIGISLDDQEKIFQEFFRVSSEQAHRKHSLGLGLNIAKRLADVLKQEISLKSVPKKGSVFSIKAPIGNVWHSDIGEPEISERIGGEFTGLTVIVLEDDEILLDALVALLERWGINVIHLDHSQEIGPQIRELDTEPDLIITDYRLHGAIQGTDLVLEVNDLLEKPCPAIVVTADTQPDLIERIKKQGFPVLIKPVSPPGLRVIMHNILYEPELVPELN
ncbi:MAG: hybrid sensor histidine kinase/response regulator [Pseudomonadota bacterium]